MSEATNSLRSAMDGYKSAVDTLGAKRRERDEAKRSLKEIETEIFYKKQNDGTIDGKNAETREAQALIAFKDDTKWQAASSLARSTEDQYLNALDQRDLRLTELRVTATLVNAEIAQTGATRLLAEVALAGV